MAVLLLTVLSAACAGRGVEAEVELRETIAEVHAQGPGALLDVGAAMPMAWDTLVVLNPYVSQAGVDAALGFSWHGGGLNAVMHNDHANLLVFIAHGRVVRSVLLERRDGDFCCVEYHARYARDEALFRVVRDEDRWVRFHAMRVTERANEAAR